jgi:uncharacterized protein with HEPN domain
MELKFMDNKKTDQYYIDKIITDLTFIRTHTESLSKSKLEEDEILVDSIMFRLIQVAENSEKLTEKFKKTYPSIPWRAIKGLRNRIVHEYGNVDLTIVYDTVKKDIPQKTVAGIRQGSGKLLWLQKRIKSSLTARCKRNICGGQGIFYLLYS